MNKVFIVGNLGQDPELKYGKSGTAILNIGVATTSSYKDKQTDEWKETTEWHQIVIFGKRAESVAQYLKKGDKIVVEGKLQTSSWEDKDGNKRYKTEIIAQSVEYPSKPKKSDTQESSQSKQSSQIEEQEEIEFDAPETDF